MEKQHSRLGCEHQGTAGGGCATQQEPARAGQVDHGDTCAGASDGGDGQGGRGILAARRHAAAAASLRGPGVGACMPPAAKKASSGPTRRSTSRRRPARWFARSGWHNTGGDRTWMAPELDTFFPDANSNRYWQPRQLDMSDYAVERTGGGMAIVAPDEPAPGPGQPRRRPAADASGLGRPPIRSATSGTWRRPSLPRSMPATPSGSPCNRSTRPPIRRRGGHLEPDPASPRRRDARAAL